MKTCIDCKKRKDVYSFGKRKDSRDGLCCRCKLCENLRYRKRYRNNIEKERSRKYKYYEENKEKVLAQQHRSYEKNKEKVLMSRKRYASLNKEKRRNWENTRRARKHGTLGKVPHNAESVLFTSQNGLCFYCKVDLDLTGYHTDHKTPLAKGGLHDIRNLCLACPPCNVRKHTKTAEQFMEVMINHAQ